MIQCVKCGEGVNVFQVRDDRYVEGEMNWVVECKNMGCLIRRTSPNRSRQALVNQWNDRSNVFWDITFTER